MRCSFHRRADATYYACRLPSHSATGIVERGVLRWCARARTVDRWGRTVRSSRSCWWTREEAEAALLGAVRGMAAREGGLGQLPRAVRRSDYRPRYLDSTLVRVHLEKLLARHRRDEPQLAFSDRSSPNVISQHRIDASRQHLLDVLSGRLPTTKLEPSHFCFDHGRLLVTDGRHRLVAARELGHRHVYIEVPQHQVHLFRQLRGLRGMEGRRYTAFIPGVGWRRCRSRTAPRTIQRHLTAIQRAARGGYAGGASWGSW